MPRLRLLKSARRDLVDIFEYLTEETGNRRTARRFVSGLRDRCAALARQPATLGTPRPEVQQDLRSFAIGRYVIFFRYAGGAFEVAAILEGHRNLAAVFMQNDRMN